MNINRQVVLPFLSRPSNGRRSSIVFVVIQLCFATASLASLLIRTTEDRSCLRPDLLNQPTSVEPQFDVPEVISNEQLVRILDKLRPRLRQSHPKINHIDHALRCWGTQVAFEDGQFLSGNEMLRLLTDHEAFQSAWGDAARPLLIEKPSGVAVRTQQGDATASHVDHTLGTLAECGLPLDTPVRLIGRTATLRDLLNHAVWAFEINQFEYEWTAMSLALYVRNGSPWFTREGDRVDFDRLARRLIRQRYGQGVCYGNHRLYSLVMLLRVDGDKRLLSASARNDVIEHLMEATRRLSATQHTEGYWDRNWYDSKVEARDEDMTLGGPLSRRILSTGHALEWWSMIPNDLQTKLHPDGAVIIRAAQWLVREIDAMNPNEVDANFTFLTHAGRALALCAEQFPRWLFGIEIWLNRRDWSRAHPT